MQGVAESAHHTDAQDSSNRRSSLMRLVASAAVAGILVCSTFGVPLAAGAERVRLWVSFSPDHLGASTTIDTDVRIASTTGRLPSPLMSIALDLPPSLRFGQTELGLATCTVEVVESLGTTACAANSIMGYGHAVADVRFGPETVQEPGLITILMGPPIHEHTSMLFYVEGTSPISAHGVFPTVLLSGSSAHSSPQLDTTVPLTPTLPGAEDLSIVDVETSLGPRRLTYFRSVHGRQTAFKPAGLVPNTCPHGGFLFRGHFTFLDGSVVTSRATVPCPIRQMRTKRVARARRVSGASRR
jgi:hypothetical protein